MSRIDELIMELSPEGVNHRSLGQVGEIIRGRRFTRNDVVEAGIPSIHYGEIYTTFDIFTTTTVSHVRADLLPQLRFAKPGDVVIAAVGETVEDVGRGVAWLGDTDVAVHDDCFMFRSSVLEPKFVAYYLRTKSLVLQKNKYIARAKVKRISSDSLAKLSVPVPPREVQREIVRILDKFTQLKEELETELEARRTQRIALANNVAVALRDQLHDGGRSDRVTLGSIARESVEPVKVQAGQSYVSLGVKWNGEGVLARDPRSGDSIKATTLYRARSGQLIYNRMFVVEGSFALVPDEIEEAVVSGEFPLFELDTSRVEPEWLLHLLCDPNTLKQIEREVTGTERGSMKSRRRWKADQFREFEISLPSIEAQRETVSLLRSSDALIRSLEDELAARRMQYEYYRDKLLTFEEAAA